MKSYRVTAVLLLSLAGLLLACNAQAEVWHRTTRVRINEPIDVPGMVLLPGTYTFTVFNPGTHIVQIWNADETHLYTSLMTVPDYRARSTDHTVLEFNETAKDAPPELRAWFYPGDKTGHEFVYPASQADHKTPDSFTNVSRQNRPRRRCRTGYAAEFGVSAADCSAATAK